MIRAIVMFIHKLEKVFQHRKQREISMQTLSIRKVEVTSLDSVLSPASVVKNKKLIINLVRLKRNVPRIGHLLGL